MQRSTPVIHPSRTNSIRTDQPMPTTTPRRPASRGIIGSLIPTSTRAAVSFFTQPALAPRSHSTAERRLRGREKPERETARRGLTLPPPQPPFLTFPLTPRQVTSGALKPALGWFLALCMLSAIATCFMHSNGCFQPRVSTPWPCHAATRPPPPAPSSLFYHWQPVQALPFRLNVCVRACVRAPPPAPSSLFCHWQPAQALPFRLNVFSPGFHSRACMRASAFTNTMPLCAFSATASQHPSRRRLRRRVGRCTSGSSSCRSGGRAHSPAPQPYALQQASELMLAELGNFLAEAWRPLGKPASESAEVLEAAVHAANLRCG